MQRPPPWSRPLWALRLAEVQRERPSPRGDDEAGRRKRAKTPKIDMDALIAQHMANAKNAKKLEAEAKKMVRNA